MTREERSKSVGQAIPFMRPRVESIEQRVIGYSVHRDGGLWSRGRGGTAPANWRR